MLHTILPQHKGHRLVLYTLVGLWVVINAGWFGYLGVRHGGDSLRYIGGAETLLTGELPSGKGRSYVGYHLYVAGVTLSGLGEPGVVAGQVASSGLAVICLYRLVAYLYTKPAGVVAAVFFIGWLKFEAWNMFILTDSLFISLPIITTYLISQAHRWWHWALVAALTAWIVLLRPEGVTYLAAVGLYVLYRLYRTKRYLAVAGCLLLAGASLPFAWPVASQFASHEFLVDQYTLGAVIWNYPPLYIRLPGQFPESIQVGDNSLNALARLIAASPLHFLRLAGSKILLELAHVRPFHAPLHNAVIVATLYPLYVLAVQGIRRPARDRGLQLLTLSFFVAKLMVVAFTFADWSGRFLIHVLWVVVIFAAVGFSDLLQATACKNYIRSAPKP